MGIQYKNDIASKNLSGSNYSLEGSVVLNQFNKNYTTFTGIPGTLVIIYQTTDSSAKFETWLDGAMLVNLTRMGVLPPPLKEYFNNAVSNWADLATGSDITAIDGKKQSGNAWLNDLLPYVNGVGTLGYAWGV